MSQPVVTLDRGTLGRRRFWKSLNAARKAGRRVVIKTGCDSIQSLPLDLKMLLRSHLRSGATAGAVGITGAEAALLLKVLQWVAIMALMATVIFMVSRQYRFKVRRNADGSIEIEGEPGA